MNPVSEESHLQATLDSERRDVRVKTILGTAFILILLGSFIAFFKFAAI